MSAKIAAIVIPLGYVSDEDFAKDCGFELADDTVTMPRAQHEALAQENERLLQSLNISHELELRERIRELEAERDQANEALSNIGLNWNALKEGSAMQLRAIRAKTIEECAQVIQEDFDRPDMAEAIRALAHASTPFDKSSGAQQDESKIETRE